MNMRRELTAAKRAVVPHDGNSFKKKLTLIALLLVWVVLEISNAYGLLTVTTALPVIRMAALIAIGRAHGIELGMMKQEPKE